MRQKKIGKTTIIAPSPYCDPKMFTIACCILGLSKTAMIKEFRRFGGRPEDLPIVEETWRQNA